MAPFADLSCVETVLDELQRAAPPFVVRMPRQPGRKEVRYLQVFGGIPEFPEAEETPQPEATTLRRAPANERVVRLEGEIGALRDETAALRREVEDLLAQFA